jgi:hypothetical protein
VKTIKIILSLILVIGIFLSGCANNVPITDENGIQQYTIERPWVSYIGEMTKDNAYEFAAGNFNSFPVKLAISGVGSYSIVNTFTGEGFAQKEYPDYKWKTGDVLNIAIHNLHSDNTTFRLFLIATTDNKTDTDNGQIYSPTPEGAENWIILSTYRITIEPSAIGHVPIALVMPKNVEGLPQKWEFDIGIRDESQSGMMITGVDVRFLITMR